MIMIFFRSRRFLTSDIAICQGRVPFAGGGTVEAASTMGVMGVPACATTLGVPLLTLLLVVLVLGVLEPSCGRAGAGTAWLPAPLLTPEGLLPTACCCSSPFLSSIVLLVSSSGVGSVCTLRLKRAVISPGVPQGLHTFIHAFQDAGLSGAVAGGRAGKGGAAPHLSQSPGGRRWTQARAPHPRQLRARLVLRTQQLPSPTAASTTVGRPSGRPRTRVRACVCKLHACVRASVCMRARACLAFRPDGCCSSLPHDRGEELQASLFAR